MIKNTRADVTQALKQVKCQRRIALTGSPLQNNLMEYYCVWASDIYDLHKILILAAFLIVSDFSFSDG